MRHPEYRAEISRKNRGGLITGAESILPPQQHCSLKWREGDSKLFAHIAESEKLDAIRSLHVQHV